MKRCRVKLGQVQGKPCTGARCPLYAARLSSHSLLSLRSELPEKGRKLSTARARLPSAFHGFAPPAARSAFPPTSCGRRAFQASDLSRPRGRAFLLRQPVTIHGLAGGVVGAAGGQGVGGVPSMPCPRVCAHGAEGNVHGQSRKQKASEGQKRSSGRGGVSRLVSSIAATAGHCHWGVPGKARAGRKRPRLRRGQAPATPG